MNLEWWNQLDFLVNEAVEALFGVSTFILLLFYLWRFLNKFKIIGKKDE